MTAGHRSQESPGLMVSAQPTAISWLVIATDQLPRIDSARIALSTFVKEVQSSNGWRQCASAGGVRHRSSEGAKSCTRDATGSQSRPYHRDRPVRPGL